MPGDALLRKYSHGGYADCYFTEVSGVVTHAQYVEAFYTTALFGLERWILSWLAARPSTDAQVRDMASGKVESFAAWSVEARAANQLLLCDLRGHTRSWLMSSTLQNNWTRLMFGSAVLPVTDRRTGEKKMSLAFRLLLGFHKLYSRMLLRAAVSRLRHLG